MQQTPQQTNGSTKLDYVCDPYGNLFAMKVNATGTWNYYTLDINGSVIAMGNSAGTAATVLYSYDPFGQIISQSGSLDTTNPYGYAGGQVDGTNVEHTGQCYLNNGLGSWLTQDPLNQISSPTQGNRYVYAANDPVSSSDPDGMSSDCYLSFLGTCLIQNIGEYSNQTFFQEVGNLLDGQDGPIDPSASASVQEQEAVGVTAVYIAEGDGE